MTRLCPQEAASAELGYCNPSFLTMQPLKRKVVAGDSDDEDVDLEKFSLKLSQFQRPSLASRSSVTGSDASSSASKRRPSFDFLFTMC